VESYIYVIAASPEGPVKIGHSRQPEKRLKQLQTGHSEKLILFHKEPILLESARNAEQDIHAQIGYRRKVGEWFTVSVEAAVLEVKFGLMRY
jgi:hypothetical protein